MWKASVICSRFNYDIAFCSICLQKIFVHSALYFKVTPCDMDIVVVFCCVSNAFFNCSQHIENACQYL
jgi:hypothetical protein